MDEKETVEKSVKQGRQRGSRHNRYSFDEKLRAVKLHLEEGFKAELVSVETGVSTSSLAQKTGHGCRGSQTPLVNIGKKRT